MTDLEIIELYCRRQEEAVTETDRAHGRQLRILAERIVGNTQDAEECVNDTYWTAWRTIPPERPAHFYGYLAVICRRFALGKLDWKNAAKRKAVVVTLSQEMECCIPDESQDRQIEGKELGKLFNEFLKTLDPENRVILMRRYWYGDSVEEIAQCRGISQGAVLTRLSRSRKKLKEFLQRKEVEL